MNRTIVLMIMLLAGMFFVQSCDKEEYPEKVENVDKEISLPELTVYKAPSGVPANFDFAVYVRYEGGEWIDLHEYKAPVDAVQGGASPQGEMSFVYFDSDFSKRIDVKVVKKAGTVNDVQIRPASKGVIPSVDGNTIEFSLTKPEKLSVEVNGNLLNNLFVFANSLETDKPTPEEVTYYFGPGVHKLGDNESLEGDGTGTLTVTSNESVYIAGGAVVYGHIAVKAKSGYARQSNISIKGRGILSADLEEGHAYSHPSHSSTPAMINMNVAGNVDVEGIILHNSVTWNIHMNLCDNVTIKDVKIISWAINSDGIDPQSSRDVLIDNCFVRNYDDCTSVKLSWYQGNNILDVTNPSNNIVDNITIQNSTYWTDQGRAILLGPEMASTVPNHILENITVKNMDILYCENYSLAGTGWAKGVIAINNGDGALVRDVLFEDIRVDMLGYNTNLFTFNLAQTNGQPFTFSGSEGRGIENVSINNISCEVTPSLPNFIHGFSSEKNINGMYFNNIVIDGKTISSAEEGNFDVNEFTQNIQFN